MNFEVFKKTNLRQKIIFSVFIALIFLLSLSIFVIMPAIQNISSISAETEAVKNTLDMKINRTVDHQTALKNYENVKKSIYLLDRVFIKSSDGQFFVSALEDLAEENNVSQSASLIEKNKEQKGFYSIIPLQISVSGEKDDLLSYLEDLEGLDYYINIKNINITADTIKGVSNKQIVESVSSGKSMVILADTFWLD